MREQQNALDTTLIVKGHHIISPEARLPLGIDELPGSDAVTFPAQHFIQPKGASRAALLKVLQMQDNFRQPSACLQGICEYDAFGKTFTQQPRALLVGDLRPG